MVDRILYDIMKRKYIDCVWYGSQSLIKEAAEKAGMLKDTEAETTEAVLSALERSKLFRKSYMYKKRKRARRKYRVFWRIK